MSLLEKQTKLALEYFAKRFKTQNTSIDVELYENLWELLMLLDFNRQIDLGLGEGGQLFELQKKFIDALFTTLFCQNTYGKFSKTEEAKKDAQIIINQKFDSTKENLRLQNMRKLSSIVSLKNSNLNVSSQFNIDTITNLKKEIKNLYDVCFDMALVLLVRMSENEEEQVNYEISSYLVNGFLKHLRIHFSGNRISYCLPSSLAIYKLFTSSKHLLNIAKDKDLINKLFSLMPYFFREEAKSISASLSKDIDLNQLVIGQGHQGAQGFQSIYQAPSISGKSSLLIPHQSPMNQQEKKPDTPLIDKQRIQPKKRLSYNNVRAASEPPSSSKNAVVPVKEDSNDDSSIDYDQKGGQVIESETKQIDEEEQESSIEKDKTNQNMTSAKNRQVPPLLINQVQSQNLHQTPSIPPLIKQQSSNNVMNNYFNMPLGSFNSTMNMNQQTSQNRNFKLNFYPQNTLVKSRLTRRQMSMSRKQTMKIQSSNNLVGIYGEEIQTRNTNNDYGKFDSQQRSKETNFQGFASQIQIKATPDSSSQGKKPAIPKLNINSIIYDKNANNQKFDPQAIPTTSHAQNKSSNRTNRISNYSHTNEQQNPSVIQNPSNTKNMMTNYQTNLNVIKQASAVGVGESDNNISIYDDANASFVNDDFQGGLLYDNAEEKLKALAIQLGESCLTNDLAALISQKRDLELAKSARKTIILTKEDVKRNQKFARNTVGSIKGVQRSISVSYKLGENKSKLTFMTQNERRKQEQEKMQNDFQNQIKKRVRLVILNIVYCLLKKYDIDEARFLKHPLHSLNAYLGSEQFRKKREIEQIKALEFGHSFKYNKQKSLLIVKQEAETKGNSTFTEEMDITYDGIIKLRTMKKSQSKTIDMSSISSEDEESKRESVLNQSLSSINHELIMRQPTQIKNKIIVNFPVFTLRLKDEDKIIFKIYQKYAFINEDISRRQVMNDLSYFAAKDKGVDVKYFSNLTSAKFNPNNSFIHPVGGMGIGGVGSGQLLSGTPVRQFQNLSFDDDNEEFYDRKEKVGDAIQSIQNPNTLWTNQGIAYDLSSSHSTKSASTVVSKEKIRKKLDVLLYSVDRRIKYYIQQFYDKTCYDFADSMLKEIITLSSYLEQQRTRIMLYQVIEVNLESLLMIKKCLIESALKTNIFVMDFTKANMGNDSLGVSPENQNYQNILIETQKKHRELFSEFLKLISILLSLSQTPETMKLLNEVLVFDEAWQESVKTYAISLFLQDMASIFVVNTERNFNVLQALEDLRGINILNFDETVFLSGLIQIQDLQLYKQAKDCIYHSLICALNVMKYYKSVTVFFLQAIKMYFSHFETQSKTKGQEGTSGPETSFIKEPKAPKETQDPRIQDKKGGAPNTSINQSQAQNKQQQKYWKHVIRRILYQFMFLITPPNGLLSQYLQNNAINYLNNMKGFSDISPLTQQKQNILDQSTSPINFSLTKSILNFTKTLFDIPDRFTKYVFIEEVMLFYIRTHYISFVRLYNKNFEKKNAVFKSKEASLQLCKKHLECLFSIAKNRNEDTRRKLYQFKVVQFLCQEIELEFELQQRRQKFFQLSKEEQAKILKELEQQQLLKKTNNALSTQQQQQEEQKIPSVEEQKQTTPHQQMKIPPLKIAGLGLSEIQPDQNTQKQEEPKSQKQEESKRPPPHMLGQFKIPPLKIAGLGLSEIIPDKQESQSTQKITSNQLTPGQQQPQMQKPIGGLGFKIPPLKVAGLGLSDLVPDPTSSQQTQQNQSVQEKFQEPPKSGMGFKIPALNITGLGLSELKQDISANPQQFNNQNNQSQSQSKPITPSIPKLNVSGLGLSDLKQDPNDNQLPTQQQQNNSVNTSMNSSKPKIPGLNIQGLGMSTLIKDDKEEEKKAQANSLPKKQVQIPPKIPALKIADLGLSDLVQDPKDAIQVQSQQPSANLNKSIDEYKPSKITPKIPLLKIGGLGLSDLVQDPKDKQQDAMLQQKESQKNQDNQHEEEEKKESVSIINKSSIPGLNIQGLGLSTLTQDSQPSKQQDQDNGESSKPQLKSKVPLLKIGGLGITGLKLDAQDLKQNEQMAFQKASVKKDVPTVEIEHLEKETIDPSNQLLKTIDFAPEDKLFQKQESHFDNTAPIQISEDPKIKGSKQLIQFNIKNPLSVNASANEPLVKESLESAQYIQNMREIKQATDKIQAIPEEEIDNNKKEKLKQGRKNLIPPRFKGSDKLLSQDDSQEVKVVSGLQIHSVGPEGMSLNNSPLTIKQQLRIPTNNSQMDQSSGRSNGSFVGKNKIFIPSLSFPEDINVDPAEKITVYQKPDDNRYKLFKSKEPSLENNTAHNTQNNQQPILLGAGQLQQQNMSAQKKGIGKRGKLLDIKKTSESNDTRGEQQDSSSKKPPLYEFTEKQFNFKEQVKQNLSIEEENKEQLLIQPLQLQKPNNSEVSQSQDQSKLKKPMIPSLRIPEKEVVAETKDKIKQQLEMQQNLNLNIPLQEGNLTKLEQSLNQANSKFQLLLDQKKESINTELKENQMIFDILASQGENAMKRLRDLSPESLMSEAVFYQKERRARPIYHDEELHVLMISLITCLLLKPQRGTLDDLYCSQYPIDNGKQNILYLLHYHLNHNDNLYMIPELLKRTTLITPPLAGQRLLKLLCTSLFDLSMYNNGKGWTKIAEGAYAKVYEAQTNLSEPISVAMKQMDIPNSIYDRCVLHDIFTEITCLEEFRLEPCVTDLYDYGVHGTSYYIVMKRYSCSLREWRLKQTKSLAENMSLYLSIFKEVLKSLAIIHSHNVTHYDIKCDNVLLDFAQTSNTSLSKWGKDQDDERLRITIGDFGECKIFLSEKDELCLRNRGTDCCKSPEMLQLSINTRKDTDKYDRRKQVGTNRLSDVWSIGALFYELLTGEYLFYDQDYCQFLFRVTRPSEVLLTEDKLKKIDTRDSVYLIDFLKYMLVRDQRLRPTIENVLKRFEHVYALLVSTSSANVRYNLNNFGLGGPQHSARGQLGLDSMMEQASQIMVENSEVFGGEIKEEMLLPAEQEVEILNVSDTQQEEDIVKSLSVRQTKIQKEQSKIDATKPQPQMMWIMEDLFLSSVEWIKRNTQKAISLGITHLIIEERYVTQGIRDKFDVLEVPDYSEFIMQPSAIAIKMNPFLLMPIAMDFLRKVALLKGRVLFVENNSNQYNYSVNTKRSVGVQCQLIRETLMVCLNAIYQTNAYETYTLIKSQNLFFNVESSRLATISKWSIITSKINHYLATFPRFQCLCGSCLIILKRQYANYSNMQTINCNCNQYYKNIETSQCPSPGCNEFISFLKIYFKVQQQESLHWGFVEEDDFMLGPNYISNIASANNTYQRQILANMSQSIDKNQNVVSVIEKKNPGGLTSAMGQKEIMQDYNLVSKSSATAKHHYYTQGYARWKLFRCKECLVWTHAINETENRYAILLNNRVKESKGSSNLGLLNIKQDGLSGVRVPILQKIKLNIPF